MKNIENYKKILILGSPGAGKTTFSQVLSSKLGIQVHHLDDYYWLENWERLNSADWHLVLNQLCCETTWIIDGNHYKSLDKRLPYADLVIFLDYSIIRCVWRFLIRSIKRYFRVGSHQLPHNIINDKNYKPKIVFRWHIAKLILLFKLSVKPNIIKMATQYSVPLIIFSSPIAAKLFLRNQ